MDQTGRSNWTLILLLWVAGLLSAAQFGKISLALSALGSVYGDGPLVALTVSLVGTVGMIFGVMAGAMIAGAGPGRALLAALALGAILSLAQALLPPLPVLLAFRLAEGVSHLVIVVAAPTLMIAAAAPHHRPGVMGLWGTFFGVSFALTASAMPGLLAGVGLGGILALHGLAMAAVALALWRNVDRTPGTRAPVGWLAEHRTIYGTPTLILPAAMFFWHTLMFVALLTFLPGLLAGPVWVAAVLPLISLAGTFMAGNAARWIAPERIAFVSFLVTAALSIGGLALLGGPVQIAVACVLFFFIGLIPGASFAAMPHFNTGEQALARAGGAIAQLGNVGTTFGTPLFALILAQGGLTSASWLIAIISLAGLVVVVALRHQIPPSG